MMIVDGAMHSTLGVDFYEQTPYVLQLQKAVTARGTPLSFSLNSFFRDKNVEDVSTAG